METISDLFQHAWENPSDINEHVKTLRHFAQGCKRVTELGTRRGVSTIAFLKAEPGHLICYDVVRLPEVDLLEEIANSLVTEFVFRQEDVRTATIGVTDLLFVDTLHTYDQLNVELTRHGNKARRYIILHDTETFGLRGELPGSKGLLPAMVSFLDGNPHWRMAKHYSNNNGLTILERTSYGEPAI